MLKIPSNEVIEVNPDVGAPINSYVVQYGDTLYSIASNNNIDVEELIKLNGLTVYELFVGQILKLPNLIEDEILAENEYVVQKGDSLYSIARKYNTTVNDIKDLNNLTSNLLNVGQILKIPGLKDESKNEYDYVVQKGDTLYSIARKYNITVDELKKVNNLNSNILSIGQKLKISV